MPPIPSVTRQAGKVTPIPGILLKQPSPRHWNPSIFKYKGTLWMAYRFHRNMPDSRSGIAISRLGNDFMPTSNQLLPLQSVRGTEHHEDPRLFMFQGEPHISYTEMPYYAPGQDYKCVVKYAKLSLRRGRWDVLSTYWPKYGQNDSHNKEKNWVFFEYKNRLHCIYSSHNKKHIVLELKGESVTNEYATDAPEWDWGDIRGGTPPLLDGGSFLTVFHSSLRAEAPPHYARYFAGAYRFESRPPFAITEISSDPIYAGSEEDGHRVDPRYVHGWKPYVVFPGGKFIEGNDVIMAMGNNDWQCVIAMRGKGTLGLGPPPVAGELVRYFKSNNSSRPVSLIGSVRQSAQWEPAGYGSSWGGASLGYMKSDSPRLSWQLSFDPSCEEVTAEEYNEFRRLSAQSPKKNCLTFR